MGMPRVNVKHLNGGVQRHGLKFLMQSAGSDSQLIISEQGQFEKKYKVTHVLYTYLNLCSLLSPTAISCRLRASCC